MVWRQPTDHSTDCYSCSVIVKGFNGSAQSTVAEVTLPPRFLSRGQTFRVVAGDTLVLPCEVEDLGESRACAHGLLSFFARRQWSFACGWAKKK
ncbi:uncharacterized protein GBIM_12916 [Gryllus bimaculatus]|nr:uncharacterized protein GBIM_12916 [Gryllus bimaculatus]